jgi:hypothetical protein
MIKKSDMFEKIKALNLVLIFLVLAWSGCNQSANQPDTSGVKIDYHINRFEKDFFSCKNAEDLISCRQKDTFLYDIYVNNIIGDISGGESTLPDEKISFLLKYIQHPEIKDLNQECEKKFGDFDDYSNELNNALVLYKYYFPTRSIPQIVTMVAPFRAFHPCSESFLGISLDMYLGPDFSPYNSPDLEFPQYQIRKMKCDFLVPNAIKAWLLSEFEEPNTGAKFIDFIIYNGKIMYALDKILPEVQDSLKMGYVSGQLEFCKNQEYQIWDNIIGNKLLYNSDLYSFRGYLGDGPFSSGPGVPKESPPKIGEYIGWQIVNAYMKKNQETDLETLFKMPSQSVLEGSKYKP